MDITGCCHQKHHKDYLEFEGERIPLTITDFYTVQGTVTTILQIVGATTEKLNHIKSEDYIETLTGPLGVASNIDGLKKVAVIGGCVGCAIAYPIAKKLHEQGTGVDSIIGFGNEEFVILRGQFKAVSNRYVLISDDGSAGEKGLVTDALKKLLDSGEKYDEVITIMPLVMIKFVCSLTKEYRACS